MLSLVPQGGKETSPGERETLEPNWCPGQGKYVAGKEEMASCGGLPSLGHLGSLGQGGISEEGARSRGWSQGVLHSERRLQGSGRTLEMEGRGTAEGGRSGHCWTLPRGREGRTGQDCFLPPHRCPCFLSWGHEGHAESPSHSKGEGPCFPAQPGLSLAR